MEVTATVSCDQPRVEAEVCICAACKGRKVRGTEELTDYHRGEYITIYTTCQSCSGKGAYIKVTARVRTTTKFQGEGGKILSTSYDTPEVVQFFDLDDADANALFKKGR